MREVEVEVISGAPVGEYFLTCAVICIQAMITHRSGHVYFIGECGAPMEETDCPVEGCFQRIGGQWGRLVASNRSLSEFLTEELIRHSLRSSRKSVHERPRNSDGLQVKWSVFWAIWLKSQDP